MQNSYFGCVIKCELIENTQKRVKNIFYGGCRYNKVNYYIQEQKKSFPSKLSLESHETELKDQGWKFF